MTFESAGANTWSWFRRALRFAEDVSEFGTVESTPTIDGRNMVMVIGPLKNKSEAKAEANAKRDASKARNHDSAPAEEATPAAPAE